MQIGAKFKMRKPVWLLLKIVVITSINSVELKPSTAPVVVASTVFDVVAVVEGELAVVVVIAVVVVRGTVTVVTVDVVVVDTAAGVDVVVVTVVVVRVVVVSSVTENFVISSITSIFCDDVTFSILIMNNYSLLYLVFPSLRNFQKIF